MYPDEGLVVEAIEFHEEGVVFVGYEITVVEKCPQRKIDTWPANGSPSRD